MTHESVTQNQWLLTFSPRDAPCFNFPPPIEIHLPRQELNLYIWAYESDKLPLPTEEAIGALILFKKDKFINNVC